MPLRPANQRQIALTTTALLLRSDIPKQSGTIGDYTNTTTVDVTVTTNDEFNSLRIKFWRGDVPAQSQERLITLSVAATDALTLSPALDTALTSAVTAYEISPDLPGRGCSVSMSATVAWRYSYRAGGTSVTDFFLVPLNTIVTLEPLDTEVLEIRGDAASGTLYMHWGEVSR